MTTSKTYVDGMLVDWGEEHFYSPVKPKKGASLTGFVPKNRKSQQAGRGGQIAPVKPGAQVIRSKVGAVARGKSAEVMVKISGGGKGMRRIKAHLDYISRNGNVALEDQDGNVIEGRPELDELRQDWQQVGYVIPEDGDRREAFNIVLSMPPGTDRVAVKRAAREFGERVFGDRHQWVMASHDDESHPHVHMCVKAVGNDMVRLNPRKADLQQWREVFAETLRDNGIDAVATKRAQRLKRDRGEKQQVRHKRARGEKLDAIGWGPPDPRKRSRAIATDRKVLHGYERAGRILANSPDVEDRRLAADLVHSLNAKVQRAQRQERSQEQGHER